MLGSGLVRPADAGCGDGDGCHEGFDVAIEARCALSPVFEPAEHALHDVTLFVDFRIAPKLESAVSFRRDNGVCAALGELWHRLSAASAICAVARHGTTVTERAREFITYRRSNRLASPALCGHAASRLYQYTSSIP
jgi:hypothetical protein